MSDEWFEQAAFDTLAVRAGQVRTSEGEQSEPLFLTSSYTFSNCAEAAARFSGEVSGNIYSRFTNPTVRVFEQRLAALEGGESCVATASGMAAILSTCMALLRSGDHVLCSRSLFGATINFFAQYLTRFGITVDFVGLTDLNAWEQKMTAATRMLFVETPSNPLLQLVDIAALAKIAHRHDAMLVVDNCLCTPVLQQPLRLGADIVIHSATKYIDGQGRCLGGAVVGDVERVGKEVFGFMRTSGPSMSPFNAWVFLKGLETLSLRMRVHVDNAQQLAEWLTTQPQVERVYYPGLSTHPQHELAMRQQQSGGGLISFEIRGGKPAAWKVIDATRMLSITANLGDAKSTITHPATTTHGRLTPEQRAAAGISDALVRIAVGLESVADIKSDLARGLAVL